MRKSLFCLLAITVLVFVYALGETYGLYEDHVDLDTSISKGKFLLKINGTDINNQVSSFVVNDFVYSQSSHIAINKLAPGTSVYYDIVLDPTDVDVSFLYDLVFDFSGNDNEYLVFNGVKNLNTDEFLLRTDVSTYTGVVSLADVLSDNEITLRVFFEWVDNVSNNEVDGNMIDMDTLSIPLTVHYKQYLGETLVEYNE